MIKRALKTICPAVLMTLLIYLMRDGKDILEGLYFVFPAMYVLIGLIHSNTKIEFFLCLLLTTTAFLIPINVWFRVRTCIDLAAIYNVLAVFYNVLALVIYWIKKKLEKRNKA